MHPVITSTKPLLGENDVESMGNQRETERKKNRDFFIYISPTAESFGVSAQLGSGVVRGDPELRFHQGSTKSSTKSSTRVPPGFHQGSTRVPPGFHEGSTRVPRRFHRGSTNFFKESGWFEVRFHKGSTKAAGWSGVV